MRDIAALVAIRVLLATCTGCAPEPEQLPPLGEAVIVVDTDARVPDLAGRLRIDVFEADGRWVDSIDLPTRNLEDWPGSFAVYTDATRGEHEVLVRLRAYPDGRVREYRGERFVTIPEGAAPTDILAPPPGDGEPRLVQDGVDRTPENEPLPNLAIDRLVRLRVHYGDRRRVRVTLRSACAGTMADLAGRASCVETEHVLVPAPLELPSSHTGGPSEAGAVGGPAPCTVAPRPGGATSARAPLYDEEACAEAGLFVLGSQAISVSGEIDHDPDLEDTKPNGTPERFASFGPLLVDRYEVTVGRYRHALTVDGYKRPDGSPLTNDGPFGTAFLGDAMKLCTYTTSAGEREDWPLTCISWFNARAFCQFYGGDLPTEAEWEYLAARAGRAVETAYPSGDTPPGCDAAVYSRAAPSDTPIGLADCSALGFGPAPVTASAGEATAVGAVGMGGNVSEWMLDSYASYASVCWAGAAVEDPRCWEEDPARRSIRGGNWVEPLPALLAAYRDGAATKLVNPLIGFRCVRRGAP